MGNRRNQKRAQVIRRALIALALIASLANAAPPRPILAQAPDCSDYGFPAPSFGWTINIGSLTGSDMLSGIGSNLDSSHNSTLDVTFTGLGAPRYISSIDFTWYMTPSTYKGTAVVTTILSAAGGGTPGDVNQESDNVISTTFLQWQTTQFFFKGQPADKIELTLSNASTSTYETLGKVHICSSTAQQFTATASSTPSPTSPPTSGPTPTNTATNTPTPTPTPSDTPASVGGSTVTPSPSPIAASSLVGGSPMAMDKKIFATVAGPKQCADVYNPCGALPFPVPPFPTINLPSPTGLPVTPFSTPVFVTGTATGTLTTGTPASTNEAEAIALATNAQQLSNSIGATPGLNGPVEIFGGGIADLNNTANQIGSNIGGFFGVVRAVQGFFLGRTGTLIAFLLLILLFTLLVRILCFALPILINFFKILFMFIGAIKP